MSRHVSVTRVIPAPVEDVFAMISDSDRLATLPGVRVRILTPGSESRDGVGLQRRVDFGAGFLVEEVVGLEPPYRFDYLLRDFRPRIRHEFGRISFAPVAGGTEVTWESRFALPAGPLTPVVEAAAAAASYAGFALALRLIARSLTRGADA